MASLTIIASGVSKSYAWTGGRIGWAVFPTVAEAHVFKNLNINYISCTSAYNQFGAKVAIESPLSPLWMERMCAAFQERRNFMVTGLNKIPGITCRNPRGAFYLFPNIADVCMKLGVITAHARMPESARQRTSPAPCSRCFSFGGIALRPWTAVPLAELARRASITSGYRSPPHSTTSKLPWSKSALPLTMRTAFRILCEWASTYGEESSATEPSFQSELGG